MTDLLIWYGQLATRRKLRTRGLLLLLGALVWLTVFLMLPLLVLLAMAFMQRSPYGQVVWSFSLGNFRRLAGFGAFGWSPDYLLILGRSAWMAAVTTVLSLVLSYPLSFFIASRSPRTRYLWLTLLIIPFCTNLVIRTNAWMLIFSGSMPPAQLAEWLGLIAPGSALYPSSLAVYVGMVTSSLPFAVLPIYATVERMDWSLVEAAQDLYAGRLKTFLHAILPQTLPGLTAATILTFIPAMGMFVVPDLLGGAKNWLVGNLIQQQFGASQDWAFGSAISLALMVLTFFGLILLRRKVREVEPL